MKMLKKLIAGLAVGGLVAGVSLQAQAVELLRFSHIASRDNTWHKGAEEFARQVEALTKGEVKVEIFPNSELGSERETLEGIPLGMADITLSGDSMAQWAPEIGITSQLFLFRDAAHVEKFMQSNIQKQIDEELIKKAGLRPLTYFVRGPRYLTSNKPIKSIADAQGLKIRIPTVPVFVKSWEAIGAKPVTMAFAEVFGALQQGAVDAQENPLALIENAKLHEVQKYLNKTAHVRQAILMVIGEQRFQSLKPEHQDAIRKAAEIAHKYEAELFVKEEDAIAERLKSKGMEFVDTDISGFKDAVKDVLRKNFPDLVKYQEEIEKM